MQEMTEVQVAALYRTVRDAREIVCCPYCGTSKMKEYRQHSLHCSGQWNTSVQFDCGAQFAYSPNLIRVEQVYMCRESPEWKARIKKVDEMREKLYAIAVAENMHETDLKKLKEKLDGWNPRWF
jgi:hypothetical protein